MFKSFLIALEVFGLLVAFVVALAWLFNDYPAVGWCVISAIIVSGLTILVHAERNH